MKRPTLMNLQAMKVIKAATTVESEVLVPIYMK